jgi:hypothetical protein
VESAEQATIANDRATALEGDHTAGMYVVDAINQYILRIKQIVFAATVGRSGCSRPDVLTWSVIAR